MARIAKALATFRSECNARWPNRSTASDGWIGDAAHQATPSDHNPNAQSVVCAFDLTHDPDNGVDCFALSEFIRNHRTPALKYIIFNGRICSARGEWVWRPNKGHEHHMHVSVGVGPDGQSTGPYDDTTPWLEGFDVPTTPQGDLSMADVTTILERVDAVGSSLGRDIAGTKTDVGRVVTDLQTLIGEFRAYAALREDAIDPVALGKAIVEAGVGQAVIDAIAAELQD